MNNTQFLEQIYEIAFGDDAINKGYTQEDVINRLMDYSNIARHDTYWVFPNMRRIK